MALYLRKRGRIWHVRGSIRVGREKIEVREFSTGAIARAEAEAIKSAEEARIRAEILEGPAGRARRVTLAECFLDYAKRPGGIPEYDYERVTDFGQRIGDRPVVEAVEAWAEWLRTRGANLAPATAARWRAIFVSALRTGCELRGIVPPKIPAVQQADAVRVRYLSHEEQEAVLAGYNKFAARPALVLCYQGLRSQEALQLQWPDINLARNTLLVRQSKNGQARTLAMHPRVRRMIEALDAEWRDARGTAPAGNVFISSKGQPYADTRGQGGNPLAQAHETACGRGGVDDFRLHDWRHHWASWQVMNGTDLITLQRMGGWKDHRSVLRYAAVSSEHMAEAIARMR